MFYGFGPVAEEAAFRLLALTELHKPIHAIYMVGNDKWKQPDEKELVRLQLEWYKREARIESSSTILIPVLASNAVNYIDNVDLFFLTADIATETKNRVEMARQNLPLIDEIKPLFSSTQDLHVNIVTNLPEVLAYRLQCETGLNPNRISGNSHVDKKRLDTKIIELMKEKGMTVKRTEAFCVGYHDDPWPVLNKMRVDLGTGFVESAHLGPEQQRAIFDFVKTYGQEQAMLVRNSKLEKSPTEKQTGAAIADFVAAYINRGRLVNASVYMDGLFMEAPTYIEDGIARPNSMLWERMTAEDKEQFQIRRKKLERIIDALGIKRTKVYVESTWELSDPTTVETAHISEEVSVKSLHQPPKPDKVLLPSSLELKLYAHDKIAKGNVKRIAEYDFQTEGFRYFEFDFGVFPDVYMTLFKEIAADNTSVYALYEVTDKNKAKRYGLVVWDKKDSHVAHHIPFDSGVPVSLAVLDGNPYTILYSGDSARIVSPTEKTGFPCERSLLDIAADREGSYIAGISPHEIFVWRENKLHSRKNVGGWLSNVSVDGGVVRAADIQADKAIFYDIQSRAAIEYNSFNGMSDAVFGDSVALAKVNEIGQPVVIHFRSKEDFFGKREGDSLKPLSSESLELTIRSVHLLRHDWLLCLGSNAAYILDLSKKYPPSWPDMKELSSLNLSEAVLWKQH